MHDVDAAPAFARWQGPLFEWFNVLREYRSDRKASGEDDVAYWYNERATLSTLAGALWRSRCLVLEEYQTLRQGNGSKAGPGIDARSR